MKGNRQGYQAKLFATGVQDEITIDKDYRLAALKFYKADGTHFVPTDTVEVQYEGEVLYSGAAVPICAISDPSDDGGKTTNVQGPNTHEVPDTAEWSQRYPIRLKFTAAASVWVITEAIAVGEE